MFAMFLKWDVLSSWLSSSETFDVAVISGIFRKALAIPVPSNTFSANHRRATLCPVPYLMHRTLSNQSLFRCVL